MQFGHNGWCQGVLLVLALGVVVLMAPGPFALAQEQPRSGGELIMAVPSEPPLLQPVTTCRSQRLYQGCGRCGGAMGGL
jgi:hypothetical protein